MRGKASFISCNVATFRITPAYAGKRIMYRKVKRLYEDHPCVCGEKLAVTFCIIAVKGSPLRMRGKG